MNSSFTFNHLINAYVKLHRNHYAHKVFDEMPEPDVVSWTSLMTGYINDGQPQTAVSLFSKMLNSPAVPNAYTYSSIVNSCAAMADSTIGKKIHAKVEISGLGSNIVVCSSLIDMYGKSNNVDAAYGVFNTMRCKNIVSWNAMISVCSQNGQGEDAISLFCMFKNSMLNPPNHYMISSVINACASIGRLVHGKVLHTVAFRHGYELNEVVATSLVDMYAKCGLFSYARRVFVKISDLSVIPYTSMIMGAAKHGLGNFSLDLFAEMLRNGINPNDVTCLGVLYACSHSGLVDEGLEHLKMMKGKYGVKPDAKHYTCVVDMLGRSGRLDEAYNLAKSLEMKLEERALVWSALLGAGRVHGRVDIAAEASQFLIHTHQQEAAAYIMMSNAYVATGKWDDAHVYRSEMKRRGIRKRPGCSWVEIKDSIYVFYAGDAASCPRGDDVVILLRELENRMKERGYIADRGGLVFVEVEEEAEVEIVGMHSERLALAFALLSFPKGASIRVMKNLRMCVDCHETFKMLSDIVGREIIVRDVNRFHHFAAGSCSCGNFW